jgi:hypothetical protein
MNQIALALDQEGCIIQPLSRGLEVHYQDQTITRLEVRLGIRVTHRLHPENKDKDNQMKHLQEAPMRFAQALESATRLMFTISEETTP